MEIRPQRLLKKRPDAPTAKTSPTAKAIILERFHESKLRKDANRAHKPTAAQRQAKVCRHAVRNFGWRLNITAALNGSGQRTGATGFPAWHPAAVAGFVAAE